MGAYSIKSIILPVNEENLDNLIDMCFTNGLESLECKGIYYQKQILYYNLYYVFYIMDFISHASLNIVIVW